MQTGNQKLNTFADVWMKSLGIYNFTEVPVFLLAQNLHFGLSIFFQWMLYTFIYVHHVPSYVCLLSFFIKCFFFFISCHRAAKKCMLMMYS